MDIKYIIFDYSEIDEIDFNEVLITSKETLRLSVDGKKTFVKWRGEMPACVEVLTSKGPILNSDEIRYILSTEEWTPITSSGTTIN